MGRVTTQEIVEHLPAVLARVAAGESLEVTDADRPVARIIPPPVAATVVGRDRGWEDLKAMIRKLGERLPPDHVIDDSRESIYREREDAQL